MTNLFGPMSVAANPDHPTEIWQLRSSSSDSVWNWITAAFTVYWLLFVAGAFTNHKELNSVGGVLILGVLAWAIVERLWVRLDAVVIGSLVAALGIPLLQLVGSSEYLSAGAVFKHASLYLAIAASRVLNLTIACRSRMRWLLFSHVLCILLISFTIYRGTSWDGGVRHSGLFPNPNNLALIPFLLLFFIDPKRDRLSVRLAIHAVVIAVLAFTGTSGAMLAYGVGLIFSFRHSIPANWRKGIYLATPLLALGFVVFIASNGLALLPETRMTNQISVMSGQLQHVLSGEEISYYQEERVLGPGSASGIWRISHWMHTLTIYSDGTFWQHIVGLGLGSSPQMMGKLPHNEYLRMLFEQGLLGLGLFLFCWRRVIATAPEHIRYIGLIVAIYSFSENNLDNFPFMALFVICLSARGGQDEVPAQEPLPNLRPWTSNAVQIA
jgi:hypothetical protein